MTSPVLNQVTLQNDMMITSVLNQLTLQNDMMITSVLNQVTPLLEQYDNIISIESGDTTINDNIIFNIQVLTSHRGPIHPGSHLS